MNCWVNSSPKALNDLYEVATYLINLYIARSKLNSCNQCWWLNPPIPPAVWPTTLPCLRSSILFVVNPESINCLYASFSWGRHPMILSWSTIYWNLFLQRIKRLFCAWKILVGKKKNPSFYFIIISAAVSNPLGCRLIGWSNPRSCD